MPSNQVEQDKLSIIEALRKTILDPAASVLDKTRAADTLGRLSDYSLFAKPQDPQQQENLIDNNTAKRIADLAERFLERKCTNCGGRR